MSWQLLANYCMIFELMNVGPFIKFRACLYTIVLHYDPQLLNNDKILSKNSSKNAN